MSVRFRIRTPAGQELSFATLEVFEDFVRSGDLSPDDLVYDAEDGSWSPAHTHPMVLEIEYQKEEVGEGGTDAEEEPSAEASKGAAEPSDAADETDEDSSLGLSLAPEQPRAGKESDDEDADPVDPVEQLVAEAEAEPDPVAAADDAFGLELTEETEVSEEEAARAFVEKMEAEREASLDFGGGAGIGGFKMDDSSTLAEMITPDEPPAEIAPRPAPKPSKPREPRLKPAPAPAKSGGGFMRFLLLVAGVGVAGGGGYFGFQSFVAEPEPIPAPTDPVEPLPLPDPEPTPEPEIPQTEAAIRERAQERFLTATQNALRDLPPIPDVWATGTYFSVPSDYPEVLAAWERYLSTIRTVRAGDDTRYGEAFEAALDDAAIPSEARVERRVRGLSAFEGSADARAMHYDRVEALASAAIQSHNALVESEGLILYEPGGSAGGETGMGAGAYGRDAEAEQLLSQVIELLSTSLEGEGMGPGDGANVRAWVWDGFLDAATR